MFTIGAKFRQVVFPQPRRVLHRLEAKVGLGQSPKAGPFVALMHKLEAGGRKHVQSSSRVSAVNQETSPPLGQPFVIESRNGIEPTSAFGESLWPQGGERLIPFDHYLGMKRYCLRLDGSKALGRGKRVSTLHQPKSSSQRSRAIVVRLRQRFQCRACFAASSEPGAPLKQPSVPFASLR